MKKLILLSALLIFGFSYSQFKDITKLDWRNLYGDDAFSYYDAFKSAGGEEDWEKAYINLRSLNRLPELDAEYSVRVALCFYLGEIAHKLKDYTGARGWYNEALLIHKGLIDEETGYSSKAIILLRLARRTNGANELEKQIYYDEAIREIKKNEKLYSDYYKAYAYSERAQFRYSYARKGVCKDVKKALKYDDKFELERELSQMDCN